MALQAASQPNILFFHVDNISVGDFGCYGGAYPAAPVELYQKTEHGWRHWKDISIAKFLSIDVPTAIAAGGNVGNLLDAKNMQQRAPPWDLEPLETSTIEQALVAIGFKEEPPKE